MDVSAPPRLELVSPRVVTRPRVPPSLNPTLTWLLTFGLTTYLALSGGGYDIVVRSEIGVAIWWCILLAALAGVFPRGRLASSVWIAFALFSGFFLWTWLAAGWSESEEQTLAEVARLATYGGVFLLGACWVGHGSARPTQDSARPLLSGLTCGIAFVCALAVLSKLTPSLFPANTTAQFYSSPRLSYPFDYPDGVGEFAALGLPLLLYFATSARSLLGRGLAAGALPVVLLCLAMTVSRGGILAAAVGLTLFIALIPDRIPRLATLGLAAAGTAVLMLALIDRPGLIDLVAVAPAGQRHSMLLITALVAVTMAIAQVSLVLAGQRRGRPGWLTVSPRGARMTTAGLVGLVAAGVLILVVSGTAGHLWNDFKKPNPPPARSSDVYFRLASIAGSHRYQYWQVAIDAFKSAPLKGIGPGTFQFYWAQHQTLGEYVLNAHSLWIETLATAGLIGFALLAGFFLYVLIRGSASALRSPSDDRLLLATAVAGVAGFCAAAAFDWVWQIGVVPMVAMLLAAIAVSSPPAQTGPVVAPNRRRVRIVLVAATLAALWGIIVPLSSTIAVRNSQAAAQRGDFSAALNDAATAEKLEPGAASPWLQRALLLEQLRDVSGAEQAIVKAEQREPTNWAIWLVGSRLATEADRPQLALTDYERARSLNPTANLFKG